MPERKESVDSFDEFFGAPKTNEDRKKSPIKPQQNDTSNGAINNTQPAFKRPQTPLILEERKLASPEPKRMYYNSTFFIIQCFFLLISKSK